MNGFLTDDFINRLDTLTVDLKQALHGYYGGIHKTGAYGQTVEFADFREYEPGDDVRRIDWNLFSRFEKYFIRLFIDERQMHTRILLDCSRSMAVPDEEKARYALKLMAGLAYISVRSLDKVSFGLLKENRTDDLCGIISGSDAFYRAAGQLESVGFEGGLSISDAVESGRSGFSGDGLTVIISDFMYDGWEKAVDYLRYKNRQACLIRVVTSEETDPSLAGRVFLNDSEAGSVVDAANMKLNIKKDFYEAYRKAFDEHTAELNRYCEERDVDFISTTVDTPVEEVIFGKLAERGIIRL